MSGNGNHGTHNGTTRGVAGIGGLQATSFNGSDDSVDTNTSFNKTELSLSIWIKWDGGNDSDNSRIAGTGRDGGFMLLKDQFIDSDNGLVWSVRNKGSSYTEVTTNKSLPQNKWVHAVGTFDETNKIELWYNGSKASSAATGSIDYDGNTLKAGIEELNGEFFSGSLASMRLYDRVLTGGEIRSLYEWGSRTGVTDARLHNGRDPGAVARYTLDGSAEDVWGANNGTNNGATFVNDSIRGQAGSFDGSNDEVIIDSLSQSFYAGRSSLSISAWAKSSDSDIAILNATERNDSCLNLVLEDDNGRTAFKLKSVGKLTTTALNDGNWHHIVATYDGSVQRLFDNGQIVAEQSATGEIVDQDTSTDLPTRLGRRKFPPDGYADITIDDVRIYDRALSPSEVHQLYQWGTRGIDMRRKLVNKR